MIVKFCGNHLPDYVVFHLTEDYSLSIYHCKNLKSHEDILQML